MASLTRSTLSSDMPSTVSPVVPGVIAPSFLYSLAYDRREKSGLNICRYPSSSGSFRLPRSRIMFRYDSAVSIPLTFSSFPWETCPTSPWVFFDASLPVWTALLGRIRARYLTARLPNPPVRPVRETFASYGSRERDVYRKLPFRQLHRIHRGQLARSLATFVPFPHPLPKGLRHVRGFPALRLLCPI